MTSNAVDTAKSEEPDSPIQDDHPSRRSLLPLAAWAAAIFLLTRLLCFAALAVGAHHKGKSFSATLSVFDGGYYRQIATHWYPHTLAPNLHNTLSPSPLGFFPLYPSAIGLLHLIGIPITAGAVLINLVAGTGAAVLIVITVSEWSTARVALFTSALWAVYPLAVVLSITYTEALFTFLSAWALLALTREQWWLAGSCVALACLTRPTGVVLVVVCIGVGISNRQVRALGVALAGAVALFGWMTYLAILTGNTTAWFVTERRGWHSYFDGGASSATRAIHYLVHPGQRPAATLDGIMLIAVVALIVAGWWQPIPRRYWAYAVLVFVLAAGTRNTFSAIPRYMLPAFPILVPIAAIIARLPRFLAWSAVGAAALVMALLGIYVTLYSTYSP